MFYSFKMVWCWVLCGWMLNLLDWWYVDESFDDNYFEGWYFFCCILWFGVEWLIWENDYKVILVVKFENIVKWYCNYFVFDDIFIEIGFGVMGLFGFNGVGKLILIKVLFGFVDVIYGGGSVFGYLFDMGGRDICCNVGYMLEDDCYIVKLSGVEVVSFVVIFFGFFLIEVFWCVYEILDFVGVE